MCGLVHISNFECMKFGKVQSNSICLMIIYLVHQNLTCSLATVLESTVRTLSYFRLDTLHKDNPNADTLEAPY